MFGYVYPTCKTIFDIIFDRFNEAISDNVAAIIHDEVFLDIWSGRIA